MTREEIYQQCLQEVSNSNFLLIEAATGFGKSKLSIDLVNSLSKTKYKNKSVSMLLLVAKTVHKQTWKDEFKKWGGIKVDSLTIECYESLKKHVEEHFDIIVMDEVHHLSSELRQEALETITYGNIIGLSATIPRNLKHYLLCKYNAKVVSCGVIDAINSNVLPEPKIILLPLQLDNTHPLETIELNPNAKGTAFHVPYTELWTYKRNKLHAIISCTQKQKLNELNSQILWEKNIFLKTRQDFFKNKWLFDCGERIKYLANLKNPVVKKILHKLHNERTITFCKTIEQAELLSPHCIHSKNKDSNEIYSNFNAKKINHISSVNILNENANLVDCKYAIFANYSSSETLSTQRVGRSLRHKSPVIILPYYENTREEEIVQTMIEGFNKDCITIIHSVEELPL